MFFFCIIKVGLDRTQNKIYIFYKPPVCTHTEGPYLQHAHCSAIILSAEYKTEKMCVCGPSMQHNCICWMCSICMFTSQTCPPSCYQLYLSIFILYLYISVVVFISSLGQCNTIVSGYAQSACLHPRHAPPISSLRPFLFYISNFLWLVFSFHVLVFISNLLPFIPFLLLHYFSFGFLFPLYLGFALPHVISSILFPFLCFFYIFISY